MEAVRGTSGARRLLRAGAAGGHDPGHAGAPAGGIVGRRRARGGTSGPDSQTLNQWGRWRAGDKEFAVGGIGLQQQAGSSDCVPAGTAIRQHGCNPAAATTKAGGIRARAQAPAALGKTRADAATMAAGATAGGGKLRPCLWERRRERQLHYCINTN